MNGYTQWKSGCAATLVLLVFVSTSLAQGLDRIRDRHGITTGRITKMSALSVTLTKSGIETKKPVEEILSILFAGEPEELVPTRRDVQAGRFEKALARLNKIDLGDIQRTQIKQEIDFLTTFCHVGQALSGQGTLEAARDEVTRFLSKNGKSYRVPAAIELLGDVLLASQDFTGARAQYAKLGKARAPYFKVRSAMLTGRSLQAEGKHQDASDALDRALQAAAGNAVAQTQVLEVTLHRAISQSALGHVKSATDAVKQIIASADPEDTKLLAQAYNGLGDCYLQAGEKKAALQAFLHVDLLFSSSATEHAKALYELSELWDDLGQSARAQDAQERFKKKYPSSRWARR